MDQKNVYTPLEKLCRDGLIKIQMAFRDPLSPQEMNFFTKSLIEEDHISNQDWPETVKRCCNLDFMKTPSLGIIRRELAEVRRSMSRNHPAEPETQGRIIPFDEAKELIREMIDQLTEKFNTDSLFHRNLEMARERREAEKEAKP